MTPAKIFKAQPSPNVLHKRLIRFREIHELSQANLSVCDSVDAVEVILLLTSLHSISSLPTPQISLTLKLATLPAKRFQPHNSRQAVFRSYATAMSSPTVKLNSGHQMPLVGFGLWKVNNDTCADQVYNAIKTGYRLFDGACGNFSLDPLFLRFLN